LNYFAKAMALLPWLLLFILSHTHMTLLSLVYCYYYLKITEKHWGGDYDILIVLLGLYSGIITLFYHKFLQKEHVAFIYYN
jgi:hypothetical protein